jgi:hypothetical protein
MGKSLRKIADEAFSRAESYSSDKTMENRHGLAVAGVVTKADGAAERRASHAIAESQTQSRWSSPFRSWS